MSHTMSVRAASFATSAALLGILVIGAFSVSITLQANSTPEPWSIPVIELPRDPPPPTPPTPREPPPQAPVLENVTVLPVDPQRLPPIDLTGEPTDLLPAVIGPPEITNPRWLRQPRDLARYYPSRALARGETGQVVLNCRVDTAGWLHCSVVSETPEGWGFGDAALRIARDYRMVPATQNGQPVEGRYRMRVPFEMR